MWRYPDLFVLFFLRLGSTRPQSLRHNYSNGARKEQATCTYTVFRALMLFGSDAQIGNADKKYVEPLIKNADLEGLHRRPRT